MGPKEWNFLLDFDGTCVDTQKPFDFWHGIACQYLAHKLGVAAGEAKSTHNDIWRTGVKKHNVHRPDLLNHYTAELVSKFFDKLGWEGVEYLIILMRLVYLTPVEAFEDAIQFMECVGRGVSLCTHADPEWTRYKLHISKLDRFIPLNLVYCADTIKPKNAVAWIKAANRLGLDPKETVVVGDSIASDVLPAVEVGFGRVFYLKRHANRTNLTSGSEIALPKGVIEISNMMQVHNYLS